MQPSIFNKTNIYHSFVKRNPQNATNRRSDLVWTHKKEEYSTTKFLYLTFIRLQITNF